MARKIQVVDDRDRVTGEKLRKCVADLMVRRLCADWIVKGESIRRRKISEINLFALPSEGRARTRYIPFVYEHHIEPKIEALSWDKTPFEMYLEGWAYPREQVPA